MNNTKGLSQILYLIIAASVLMIAALSLVLMLNQGLEGIIDFGGTADRTGCERAIQTSCTGASQGTTVKVPGTCVDENDNVIPPASNANMDIIQGGTTDPNGDLTCSGA